MATSDIKKTGEHNDVLMVYSVEKAFRILNAFSAAAPALTLTDLTEATGIDKSAVQRFTHTLSKLGYLKKDPRTKQYELGVRVLDLGAKFTGANRLIDRAMPFLQHLSRETDETVSLSVLDDTEIVFISRFINRHILHTNVVVGTRLPAYCTAPGRAILAYMPPAAASELLDRSELKSFTPFTIWERSQLGKALEQVRSNGYATAFSEYFHGDLSIAAPLLDANGQPLGAINVAVSESRCSREEAVARFAPLVVAAARSAS